MQVKAKKAAGTTQYAILRASDIPEDDIPQFADSGHWLRCVCWRGSQDGVIDSGHWLRCVWGRGSQEVLKGVRVWGKGFVGGVAGCLGVWIGVSVCGGGGGEGGGVNRRCLCVGLLSVFV